MSSVTGSVMGVLSIRISTSRLDGPDPRSGRGSGREVRATL